MWCLTEGFGYEIPGGTVGRTGFDVQVVADPRGNVGIALKVNLTPVLGVFGASATAGMQGSVSTAANISQLKGLSYAADISAGVGPVFDRVPWLGSRRRSRMTR